MLVKEIALFNISYLCLYLDNCKFKPANQVDFLLLQHDEEIYKPNAEDFEYFFHISMYVDIQICRVY